MKKIYNFLLFTILCFMCFIGVTNATTKTCSYIFDTTENNNYLEEYSLNFNLTFSDDGQGGLANFAMKINGKELVPYSANGEIYELENLPSTVFTNPKNSDKSTFYIFKSDNFYKEGLFEPDSLDNYYINDCPPLYAYTRTGKINGKGKDKNVLVITSTVTDAGAVPLKTKVEYKQGQETIYTFGVSTCDATSVGKTEEEKEKARQKCEDLKGAMMGQFHIKVDKYGKYSVSIDSERYTAVNEDNDYVWEGSFSYYPFVIRKSEWQDFKNVFKFNPNVSEDTSKSVIITPIGGTFSRKFVLSVNSISDGSGVSTDASGDYNSGLDGRYTFKLIDLIIDKDAGTCESYLGLADEEGKPAYYLQIAFTIIKLVSILLVIVMSMVEFAGVISSDKDKLKETINKFVKRLIILIVILLIPTFIDMIGNILDIENILCGIK